MPSIIIYPLLKGLTHPSINQSINQPTNGNLGHLSQALFWCVRKARKTWRVFSTSSMLKKTIDVGGDSRLGTVGTVGSPGHCCDEWILRREYGNKIGLTWVCATNVGYSATNWHGSTILKTWTNHIWRFFFQEKQNVNSHGIFSRQSSTASTSSPVSGKSMGSTWRTGWIHGIFNKNFYLTKVRRNKLTNLK